MFRFIKDYFYNLIILYLNCFYFAYFVTVMYLITKVHKLLLSGKDFNGVDFGVVTFIIFAFLPIILWKMTSKTELPMLKETTGLRYLLSWIAIAFTVCIFISKAIFNSVAKSIVNWDSNIVFDAKGRIVLVEILSVGIPLVIFLYLCKKIITYLVKDDKE